METTQRNICVCLYILISPHICSATLRYGDPEYTNV
jgi:hypothetical protein